MAIADEAREYRIVRSKLTPPRPLTRHLHRAVVERIIETLDGWRAVFLSAPIGYGKTTAMADVRRGLLTGQSPCVASWVTFDSGDQQDAGRAWAHLMEALARLYPDALAEPVGAFLGGEASLDETCDLVSDALFCLDRDEVGAGVAELLVLDDLDQLGPEERAAMLDYLLTTLPPSARILGAASPFDARGLGYLHVGDGRILGMRDMTLSKAEGAALVRTLAGDDVPAQLVYDMVEMASGWAMGVVLLASGIGKAPARAVALGNGDRDGMGVGDQDGMGEGLPAGLDLLDNQVVAAFFESYLSSRASDFSTFCMDASVLDVMCEGLCRAIADGDGGARFFGLIAEGGTLAAPYPGLDGWYAFHPMLLRWLRRRLVRTAPRRARRVCQRACAWYESRAMPSQAAKFMAMGSDYEFIGNLAASMGLARAGGKDGFLAWAMETDPDALTWDVVLNFYAIWAYYFAGDAHRSLLWAENLSNLLAQGVAEDLSLGLGEGHMSDLHSMLDLVRIKCDQYFGEYEHTVEGLSRLVASEGGLAPEILCLAWHALGEAQERLGDLPTASASYLRANGIAARAGSQFYSVFSRFSLAWLQAHRRELVKAEETCCRALEECPADFSLHGSLHVLLAYIHLQVDDVSKAAADLDVAKASFAAGSNADMLLEYEVVRSMLIAAKGDGDEAYRHIVGAVTPHAGSGMPRGVLQFAYYIQARLAMERGDAADASAALANLEATTPKWDRWYVMAADYARARLLHAAGDSCAAKELATGLVRRARDLGFSEHELDGLLLLARIDAEAGDAKGAMGHVLDALHLGAVQKAILPFLTSGQVVTELLFKVDSERGATSMARLFARSVLAHVRGSDTTKRENVSAAVATARLSAREREVLALLNQGYSRVEMAERLGVSINTVKTHLGHIYDKLGVDGRSGAFSASLFDESSR